MKARILFSILALWLLSCGNSDTLPKYAALGDLRVLSLIASQPEVSPGDTVTITPLVSDLNGGGRTLSVQVQACADPGVALGRQPVCSSPDVNTSSSFSSATLDGTYSTYTGAAPTFSITVPSTLATYAVASSVDQYNGVSYLVLYTVSASDGSSVSAYKRLVVSNPTKSPKNQNPAISGVTSDGTALSALNAYSSAITTLTPAFSVGAESYLIMNTDGSSRTVNEELTTTWFYTDGSLKYPRTEDTDGNEWTPPGSKPPSHSVRIVVVTHDGRGGEAYQIYDFN